MRPLILGASCLLALFTPSLALAGDSDVSRFDAFVDGSGPIGILLLVVIVVLVQLPKIELGHSVAFRVRRVVNWLPLGLTYAFLYMARYNLEVSHHAFGTIANSMGDPLMSNAGYAEIFMWGTLTYGVSFIVNGPMTDRLGGRFAILLGAGGAAFMNAIMGLCTWSLIAHGPGYDWIFANFIVLFSVLYAANMYFQSFGAVAIVKVNSAWFHTKERGFFGAMFGILISLGSYFAFDWGYWIVGNKPIHYVFFIPVGLLAIFMVLDVIFVRNTPGETGHKDFDTADASSGDTGPQLGAVEVFKLMLKNPIIITIALVEFCSGFLRQSIMQWFRSFAKQTNAALGLMDTFVYDHWGLMLCCAGIMGGVFAGVISDRVFQARRGPVAAILYGGMLVSSIVMIFVFRMPIVGVLVAFMSLCIIGVHGMLSGTATMDFGGKKNAGVAVGIIDGFVYLGTAAMSLTYMFILPQEELDANGKIVGEATNPDNWASWPISMALVAFIGLIIATRLWNAKPQPKVKTGEQVAGA